MAITVTAANLSDTGTGFITEVTDPLENMSSDNAFYAGMIISIPGNPKNERAKHSRLTAILTCTDNLGNKFSDTIMLATEQTMNPDNGVFYTILLKKSPDAGSQVLDKVNGMRLEVGTTLFGGAGGSISIELMGRTGYNGAFIFIQETAANGALYVRRFAQSGGHHVVDMPFVIS